MFVDIVMIVVGAILLGFGADRFIVASSALAERFNVPKLITGMVLVGFGTSFPELIVSATAAFHAKPDIAIGNVVGSNIANIGLVLGLAALIRPMQVHSRLIKRELPLCFFVFLVMGVLFWQYVLSRVDGLILLLLLFGYLYWMVKSVDRKDPLSKEIKAHSSKALKTGVAVIWWVIGLGLLFISSEMLVNGAVNVAKLFGISDLVIGLTIVTIGTSLPEFAATITSVIKNEHDIAVGHVVGSNIFNALAVLAMPALISPGAFSKAVFLRDYPVMLAFTLVLWGALVLFKRAEINRWLGALLFLGYVVYLGVLVASY